MRHKKTLKSDVSLVEVNASNVSETGFFCYMSKKKSEGYRRKLDRLKQRSAEGLKKLGKGLTITGSDQCPYLEDATRIIEESANEMGIESQVVNLKTSRDIQKKSPSAYGVLSITYKGDI
jgi:hypothetical protein